jgi:hypothetical protein
MFKAEIEYVALLHNLVSALGFGQGMEHLEDIEADIVTLIQQLLDFFIDIFENLVGVLVI